MLLLTHLHQYSFREDQRNGMGEYKWPDGACYKGFFRMGHRDGEGEYRFAGMLTSVCEVNGCDVVMSLVQPLTFSCRYRFVCT